MPCRGVRGATMADANSSDEILKATRELLALLIRRNEMKAEDVASVIFTTTPDLDAEFPALAARQLNWSNVALMCAHELEVPGSLKKCIRILIHWNTDKSADEIQHVYIKGALSLRPDLSDVPPVDQDELERWISQHINEDAKSHRK
jgi:chorismate mutase